MREVEGQIRLYAKCLGLDRCPPLHRDRPFLTALLAGGGFWLLLWLCVPVQPLALWQPLVEELLFRGVLQGQWCRRSWGQRAWSGMTVANIVTSLLFMLGHWWHHPPLWAMAMLLPSLLFGYLRDPYTSVYPAIALHIFYNTGYF